jgi:hypothetical protein
MPDNGWAQVEIEAVLPKDAAAPMWPERYERYERAKADLAKQIEQQLLGGFKRTQAEVDAESVLTSDQLLAMVRSIPAAPPPVRIRFVDRLMMTTVYTGIEEMRVIEANPIYETIPSGGTLAFTCGGTTHFMVRVDEARQILTPEQFYLAQLDNPLPSWSL